MRDHAIIRTALALGHGKFNRKNFIDWILDKIKKGKEIPLFTDASAISFLVKNIWLIELSDEKGIFHQFGVSCFCRYDIGKLICKDLNLGMDLLRSVKVAKMAEYPRPLDVSLITKRTVYGKKLILPGIKKVITDIL